MAKKRWDLHGATDCCLRKFSQLVIDLNVCLHQRMLVGNSAQCKAWQQRGIPCVEVDDVAGDAGVTDPVTLHPLITLAQSLDKARRVPRPINSRTHALWISDDGNESQVSVFSSPCCSARQLPLIDIGSAARWAEPVRDPEFMAGSTCETVRSVTMRCGEDLDSEILRRFPPGWLLEVLELGTGPTGRRMRVREEMGRIGWVSFTSAAGRVLIRQSRVLIPQSRPWLAKVAQILTDRVGFRAAHPEVYASAMEGVLCELAPGAT